MRIISLVLSGILAFGAVLTAEGLFQMFLANSVLWSVVALLFADE